ncbi:uncharacterized protein Tco025E_09557, partial [Trypanosoma conorhini]
MRDEEEEASEFGEEDKAGATKHHRASASRSCSNSAGSKGEQADEGDGEEEEGEENRKAQRQSRPRDVVGSVEESRAAKDEELRREWPYFTSRPQPTDNVEYAVAVCAPMSCVISYKYRA